MGVSGSTGAKQPQLGQDPCLGAIRMERVVFHSAAGHCRRSHKPGPPYGGFTE